MNLTVNARRFQRTHPLSGTGSSVNASKDIGMGGTDLAPTFGSEPVVDAVHAAVVGSSCAVLELDAYSVHKVTSSDVCHDSLCWKNDDVIIFAEQYIGEALGC